MVTCDDHSSSSKQRRIRSLLLHHGHKPLTSTGPYHFLSLSNRGPSRRSDGTGFVIHSSPMTSQVEVELPTFHYHPARALVRRWAIRLSLKPVWHGFDKGEVGREWTVANLAEAGLYLMAVDQRSDGDAAKVVEILEEWMSWGSERKPQKGWSRS
jgi:hypothetical protein